MEIERALRHCALEVRRYDYDRYLCAMFAKANTRSRLFALYAFNLELARIAESVSEPALGDIRLQWWRDTLDGVYRETPLDHPVAVALSQTGAARSMSRDKIESLIDARTRDLDNVPPADRGELIAYAEGTSSTLLSLALDIIDIAEANTRAAARPLGRAWALTGIIRATGYLAARRRCLLPVDLMGRFGLTEEMVLRGTHDDELQSTIAEIAVWAEQDLTLARQERTPRSALPVMLTATLTRSYLRRLRRAAFDPYHARLATSPLARQVKLLGAGLTNRP